MNSHSRIVGSFGNHRNPRFSDHYISANILKLSFRIIIFLGKNLTCLNYNIILYLFISGFLSVFCIVVSLGRSAANEPKRQHDEHPRSTSMIKIWKRQWKRHKNKRKDLFRMKSNKRIPPNGKIEGVIVATALPPGEYHGSHTGPLTV